MKVLVIGGSSFIGVYTINELKARNIDVVATGRNPKFNEYYNSLGVPYLKLDICDTNSFEVLDKYEFDAVVSLAAMMPANVEKDEDYDDTSEYIKVNVLGILNILEYCRKRKISKVVDIISRFDIRLYDTKTIINEDTPLKFSYTDDHAAYVLSNNAKAEMLKYYNEKYKMKNVWLRIPSIYGVGPHGTFCKDGIYIKSGLQIFMDKAKDGETIEVFGDPNTPKDVLYVKDMAIAIAQSIMSKDANGLYNISYDENFSIMSLAVAVSKVFSDGKSTSKVVSKQDTPNNGGFPKMSNLKAKTELGFVPMYDSPITMMQDYKYELDRGVITKLFGV